MSAPAFVRDIGPLLAGSALPFVLILYLGLKGGGYDEVVYGQVGIIVWWLVLLGCFAGVLPAARLTRPGWVALALLAAFAAWTALGIGWSESSERSVSEVGRLATYLGVFTLALFAQGKDSLRRNLNAAAAAISVIALLAVLSRLHPSWFPTNETTAFLPEVRSRLSYPLNYWNGLAALLATGLPLVVLAAVRSRTLVSQALSAAGIPLFALGIFLTLSRGGAIEATVGMLLLVALFPRRLELVPTLAFGSIGAALLIFEANQRDALTNGLLTPAAKDQGNELLVMLILVCAGVAVLQVVSTRLARPITRASIPVSRGAAISALSAAALVALVIGLLAGAPGEISDRWQDFKQPLKQGEATKVERFQSSSGSGRYQYWESALNANATDPVQGIGPGTFEFWWDRDGTIPGSVRNAHSLYLETLAELGIVGLSLIGALMILVVFVAIRGVFRAEPPADAALAAATAASAAFLVAAGIDWVWQLAVLPVSFLLIAAAVISHEPGPSDSPMRPSLIAIRVCAGLTAVAALVAIFIPVSETQAVRKSQDQVREKSLDSALDDARSAERLEPYAASPKIQEALILELRGRLGLAAQAAEAATAAEATNWKTYFVLSRIEAERGRPASAVHAYRRAKSLNPRSSIFSG